MAYGVKYAGSRGFGYVNSPGQTKTSLASLMGGNVSMQPASSSGFNRPTYINSPGANPGSPYTSAASGFQAINQPPTPKVTSPPANRPDSPDSPANTSLAGPAVPRPADFTATDEANDPILTQIRAAGQRGVQDAASSALAGAKNDLINYGGVSLSPSLRDLLTSSLPASDSLYGTLPGNPVLGALNDQGTAQAASANPYSTLAKLMQAHTQNTAGIDQATNANNTYYGSVHANALGQEGSDYLGAQNDAAQNLASLLSGENQNVLGALNAGHSQYETELPNAYQRWVAGGGTAKPPPTGGASGDGSGGDGGPNTSGGLAGTSALPYDPLRIVRPGQTNRYF